MAHLTLSLLGPFQANLDGKPIAGFESDKVRALLAYLATESDQPHSRGKLAGLLWPERPDQDARSNLRYALSNLRRAIGDREATPPFLNVSRQTIEFNTKSDSSVDVVTLAAHLEQPPSAVLDLEKAIALYRGDFLEGFFVADSVPFEEWMLLRREQLRRQLLAALHRLAAAHEARGDYTLALPYAYRQVELEPWEEKAHRQLMRLLALDGQRGAALAQYEACRHALAAELGAEPARDTTALYEQIRDEAPLAARSGPGAPGQRAAVLTARADRAAAAAPEGTQKSKPRWRALSRRVGTQRGALLLVVIAAAAALALYSIRSGLFGAASPAVLPTYSLPTPPAGKILEPCEGIAPPQICVYDTLSGQVTQLTEQLGFGSIGRMSWSPDAEQIVFDASAVSGGARGGSHRLYVVDAGGSDPRQLADDGPSDVEPAWSPDGELIAFNHGGELWVIRPDGTGAQRLAGGADGLSIGDLAWSPDSELLAFVAQDGGPPSSPEAVWVVSRDGAAAREVYSLPQGLIGAEVLWSDDGQAILCNYAREGEERELRLVEIGADSATRTVDSLPYWWHPTFWPQWGAKE